ncbi:MAG: serine/threonine-protein kinase, partial [Gemmataceae bacterium]
GFFLSGKYKVLDHLGTGGMGMVLLCEHLLLQRIVAVKVLNSATVGNRTEAATERFYREARAVAALDHPNIVRVFDIDQFENTPYMVIEYVDGSDLQKIVAGQGPLPILHAIEYTRQAARGLQHAFENKLIHRDIKPSNILVDRSGSVKLLDLGLARFLADPEKNQNLTERFEANSVLGTADYMAPEQAIGGAVDIRSDLYSLGGTLFFLLTGRMIFEEATVTQKLLWHQMKAPPAVTQFRSDVPPDLIAILEKLLAKKPEDRFQTPTELVAALDPFLQGQAALKPLPEAMPTVRPDYFRLGLSSPPSTRARVQTPGAGIPTAQYTPITPSQINMPKDGPPMASVLRAPSSRIAAEQITIDPVADPITMPVSTRLTANHPLPTRPNRRPGLIIGLAGLLPLLAVGLWMGLRTQAPTPNQTPTPTPTPADTSSAANTTKAPASPVSPVEAPVPIRATIAASGSTFIDPLMQHWASIYFKDSSVRVVYKGTGSSKGVQAVLDQQTDFGCTDAYLTDEQLTNVANKGGQVLHVPLVHGAVVPIYNVPDLPQQLRFTGPLLADIFLGRVV